MAKSVKKAWNFFSTMYAALIIIAMAVAFFVYSLVKTTDDPAAVIFELSDNGTMSVSPSDFFVPNGPPNVTPPETPPPSN